MPPAPGQEHRLLRVEEATTTLTVKLAAVEGKTDLILSEVRGIGDSLKNHVKDDDAVERRVQQLEFSDAARAERRKTDGERHRNVQAAIWLAGLGLVGDVVLQLLTHLHLIP